MRQATVHRLGSVTLGALLAVVLVELDIDVVLAGALGVAFATSVLLLARTQRQFPTQWAGGGWRDGRWTPVWVLTGTVAALVGVQGAPLPGGYHAAVSFLLILTGLTAYVGGSLAVMERERGRG